MYPVQLFGLYEMLRQAPVYDATVTAATECVLLEFSAQEFSRWIYGDNAIALIDHRFLHHLAAALGIGLELADGVHLIPPKLHSVGVGALGRVKVQDAAPVGELLGNISILLLYCRTTAL